ncbi:MmcQ/YjbR family DNA-binding protein [Candidatus Uabimicrobium sp. HlEnr_7]|uniref:MmcQ/YjbR family DNA-binding protein n=1 Tax=Candidatus Uabimicrobium helgolandensis TaxID=3095367 RepID=UPI0035572BD2
MAKNQTSIIQQIRECILQYPEVQESTVCNRISFKVNKKNVVFVGEKNNDLMVKLESSLPQIEKLEKKYPENYKVGKHGWTTIVLSGENPPSFSVIREWLDESYRLLTPKKLLKLLDEKNSSPDVR